jgi:hypothetical protein
MYTLFDEKVEVKKYSHQNSIAICESYMVISTGKRANFEEFLLNILEESKKAHR